MSWLEYDLKNKYWLGSLWINTKRTIHKYWTLVSRFISHKGMVGNFETTYVYSGIEQIS